MEKFHDKLKKKMNEFVHLIYRVTKDFPKSELYGATSQLRRAALSIILNYIEGYARKRQLVKINFFETSYGSLKESKYLLDFALEEKWVGKDDYELALSLSEEIGAMLWRTIEHISRDT
jgi:four helix bundle protein